MKIEPNADVRQVATLTFEWYTAFLDSGFTEAQAMELVSSMIRAMINGGTDG